MLHAISAAWSIDPVVEKAEGIRERIAQKGSEKVANR